MQREDDHYLIDSDKNPLDHNKADLSHAIRESNSAYLIIIDVGPIETFLNIWSHGVTLT